MKQQLFATKKQPFEDLLSDRQPAVKKPSRLCKFLLALLGFKIGLLGIVVFEPVADLGFILPSALEVATVWQHNPGPVKNAQVAEVVALQPEPQDIPATAVESSVKITESRPAPELSQPAAVSASPQNITRPIRRAPGLAFAATPVDLPQNSQGDSASPSVSLEALNRKQEELGRKEQDLKTLQAELDARFQQMQDLEQRLKIMLKDAEEMKDARYRHLVDVLSNMKARQAAEVLSTLDEKVAVRVLAGMRGRQAGEILSLADPIKAARLAEALSRMQMPLE
jgi:flagellar motility protein MotE (MotC chaperone)